MILSAKYGFLLPDEKISDYDAYCSKNPEIKVPELKNRRQKRKLSLL